MKRNFVTTHQLRQRQQQQQQQQQMKTRKSPRLCNSTVQDTNEKDKGTARRKLDLQTDTGEGEKTGENDVAAKVFYALFFITIILMTSDYYKT